MFKSRTITISLRFYGALAVAALLGAFLVGVTSQHSSIIDQVAGPLDLGWKGGVGNHLGYTVLVGVAVAAIFLAVLFTAWRDADANGRWPNQCRARGRPVGSELPLGCQLLADHQRLCLGQRCWWVWPPRPGGWL